MRVLVIGLDSRAARPETASYAVRWAREMSRHVEEYVVVCQSDDGSDRGPIVLADNATAYAVGAGRAAYTARAARLAMRLHSQSPFDVCTTEDPFRAGLAGLLFSRRTGVALNVENHSLHVNNPDWISERTRNRLYNRVGLIVMQYADTIRNYSPDQAGPLLEAGVPVRRIFTVPPPTPELNDTPREEARRLLGIDPNASVVLSAGRMVAVKNGTGLLDAFALVAKRRYAKLMMAGDGPERERWTQHARTLGIENNVTWLGMVPEERMPLMFAAADVYALASLHETGPRTVLESFAAGVPVVGTERMGVVASGVLTHGETGFVVRPHDASWMADAIAMLLDDADWAAKMGAEGRRRLAPMDHGSTARRVLAMFQETAWRRRLARDGIAYEGPTDGFSPTCERIESVTGGPEY